ncbi:MAG: release factor glutamine methyltransferase [Marivirga sp.]|jgi:release factor glutamine methyltransferase
MKLVPVNKSMNTKTLFQSINNRLTTFESAQEAEGITYLLLEHIFQKSRMDVITESNLTITEPQIAQLNRYIERLKQEEPIQHILGSVEFYGRKFLVNKNVLIPRPETEELVHLLLTDHPDLSDMTIIDIGTGSGIIPITIKKERPEATIIAIDISEAALATARRNAQLNNAKIEFMQADILQLGIKLPAQPHIIISNPPYVTLKEKAYMEKKVTDYDPTEALFVPDDQPLLFYERITKLAAQVLQEPAHLYFEINENYGIQTKEMIEANNFKEVMLYKDLQGKDRIISAQLY